MVKIENFWFRKEEVRYVLVEKSILTSNHPWHVIIGIDSKQFVIFQGDTEQEALDVVEIIRKEIGENEFTRLRIH